MPGWSDKALDRGVRGAPEFFPDDADSAGYAGGIDLMGTGEGRVAALKKKYRNQAREALFEGW